MARLLSRLFGRLFRPEQLETDVSEFSVHPPGLTFLTDVTPGHWVEARLTGPPASMSRLVPEATRPTLASCTPRGMRPTGWFVGQRWRHGPAAHTTR